jgi:hypothetical protein
MIRPENKALTAKQKRRVLARIGERGFTCGSCGSDEFEVGDALYLGFLFLDEDNDSYMVALTCKETDCDALRTGIRLHEADFLKEV